MIDRLLAPMLVVIFTLPLVAFTDGERGDSSAKYGCTGTDEGEGKVTGPRKTYGFNRPLSTREQAKWGPIQVTGIIGCDGRLHDLKIHQDLPRKLEAKLLRRLGKWRYRPATRAGKPVAMIFKLMANESKAPAG